MRTLFIPNTARQSICLNSKKSKKRRTNAQPHQFFHDNLLHQLLANIQYKGNNESIRGKR